MDDLNEIPRHDPEAVAADIAAREALNARGKLRSGVARTIGDPETQIGKMNDVVGLTTLALLVKLIVTGKHPSNDADRMFFRLFREALGLEHDELADLAQGAYDKITDGTYRLSAPAKPGGVSGSINDGLSAQTDFVNLLEQMVG